jgi:hypothetical protein
VPCYSWRPTPLVVFVSAETTDYVGDDSTVYCGGMQCSLATTSLHPPTTSIAPYLLCGRSTQILLLVSFSNSTHDCLAHVDCSLCSPIFLSTPQPTTSTSTPMPNTHHSSCDLKSMVLLQPMLPYAIWLLYGPYNNHIDVAIFLPFLFI